MAFRRIITLLPIAFTLALSACGGGGGSETDSVVCTTEVRSSVLLTALDTNSVPVASTSVTYQINDGPAQVKACPASGECPVGEEQSGRFRLTVSKVGFVSATTEVQVNRDLCHVTTEQTVIVLRQAS